MSRLQQFILGVMPTAWRESAIAESKLWMVECPICRHERTYWEMGGLRWKGRGSPRIRGTCPACGNTVWFRVYKKENA